MQQSLNEIQTVVQNMVADENGLRLESLGGGLLYPRTGRVASVSSLIACWPTLLCLVVNILLLASLVLPVLLGCFLFFFHIAVGVQGVVLGLGVGGITGESVQRT